MSGSRLPSRLLVVALALLRLPSRLDRRKPAAIRRILIAHHLLLGDTLMLTPLLAKLRERHPTAEIWMTVPKAFYPLYATAPYGVRAVPYDPYDAKTLRKLIRPRGFDLALLPADNRYSWLAFALGSRWIVGFSGDRGRAKNWMIDELKTYSSTPQTWGDMVAELIEGPPPRPFTASSWPLPTYKPFARPAAPYCVLHVGAGNPLRFWEKDKWAELARWLTARGQHVVWSAGPGEKQLVETIDPEGRYADLAGALDLPQLWQLLAGASLVVSPDTGIAHLARLSNTPAVTLYGPGTPVLFGPGHFWSRSVHTSVWVDPFPCRDQWTLYYRVIDWVRRCERFPGSGPDRCPEAKCMQAISLEAVQTAIQKLIGR